MPAQSSHLLQSTVELIQDGSFELGNPNPYWSASGSWWIASSGWCSAHTGSWFGHLGEGSGWIEQTMVFPTAGPVSLQFYLAQVYNYVRESAAEDDAADGLRAPPPNTLTVLVDSSTVFTIAWSGSGYVQHGVDLSGFATGTAHTLRFAFNMNTDYAFCLDDVSITGPAIPQAERDALVALYNSTNGSGWTSSAGWLGPRGSECSWYGVVCSSGHVRTLNLDSNNLNGTIPSEIANLPFLAHLYLNGNQLSGNLPSSIGSLSNLNVLAVNDNLLVGELPTALTSLTSLDDYDPYYAVGGLRLCNNQFYTDNGTLLTFLAQKAGPDWESCQIPTVRFSWTPLSPQPGEPAQFTDTTFGQPTSWYWSFGDDGTSIEQHPSHIWLSPGSKSVTLTASNSVGSDSATQTVSVSMTGPVAEFTSFPTDPAVGAAVQFTDASSGYLTYWSWDFGDGATSTLQNPTHTYSSPGQYQVDLTVGNTVLSDSVSHSLTVWVSPTAEFSWSPTIPGIGQTVQFTDLSTDQPTSWSWDFGDGGSSTAQNPTYAFSTAGDHTVTLTVTNPAGSDSVAHTVTGPDSPTAEFSWSPTVPGIGQTTQFTDQSSGGPTSWSWTFGDGGTSTAQSPTHAFSTAGDHIVSLTVSNAAGSDGVSHTVTVSDAPTADFSWSPTTPARGELVQFTDLSGGSPTSWAWDFGDDDTSSLQNPRHVFSATGSFTVTLTVANAGGSDSVSHTLLVGSPPEAEFTWSPTEPDVGETVRFTDQSTSQPDSWTWDFGDGATSPYSNTSHVYTRAGVYDVTLTVSNVVGTDSVTHPITVGDPALELSLSWRPESPRLGEPVVFTLTSSSGVPTAVSWDFGAPGCAGSPEHGACTTTGSGCETWMHRFSRPGEHTVSVRAVVEGGLPGATSATLSVSDTGSCDSGSWCGDGRCNVSESAIVCPADCPPACGNLVCEVAEDPCNCASDCRPVCGNGICESGEGWVECPDDCERPDDFAGGGVETCRHCLLPAAVGLEPGLAGTLWRGEAMLSNLDPEAPLVFWSVFTPDSPGAKYEVLTSEPAVLEPGESLYFSSFVEEVFGVSDSGNVQLMADVPMAVTTRIYNTGDEGTYGQLVDAFDASSIVCPGQMAILIGLQQDADYRTNVFVQDVSGVGASFELEVSDSGAAAVGSTMLTVAAGQTLRMALNQVPGVAGLHEGYATVRVTAGGRVAVIASVVDNATGDAVTVKPIVMGRIGKVEDGEPVHALVPVVARADGFEGTVWRTQLVVKNLGAAQDVRLELHPSSGATPVEQTFTLEPRTMIASSDIVEMLLGDVQAQGALHVYSETPVGIDSRTRNLGSNGTYGDSLDGLRSGDLLHAGETGSLELLESSATFRTNIGFANLAEADATVELTLYRLVGTLPVALGARTYTVPAMRTLQVNKVFETLGVSPAQPARATVRVVSGGPVYAYASKVDNATGDPTNIVAVPMR